MSPSLEALDVSWNELPSVEGLICLGDLCSFCEIQMEGNPVCKSSDKCVCVCACKSSDKCVCVCVQVF